VADIEASTATAYDLRAHDNAREIAAMNVPKRRLLANPSLALLAAVFLAGAAPAMAQGKPWKHAIVGPKSDAAFQVMSVRGAFAYKQGIDIQLPHVADDAAGLSALLAGELDSYDGSPATAIIAGSRDADVKIIGCHWQSVVDSVFARHDLKGPHDMKGQIMAVPAPTTGADMIGKAWLRQNDIALDDVTLSSLGSDSERYQALLGKAAMAAVLSIEFLPVAQKQRIKLMARGSEVMPKYLRLCTVSTGKNLEARRQDAIRFLSAQMQGYQYSLARKDEVIRLMREITKAKPGDPRAAFIFNEAANPNTGIDPAMPIDMDKLSWLQEQLVAASSLKQAYDLTRIVDTDIRKEALKRAGL
jgi:NitT/TauT family transport system substrate-binding protein